MVGQLGDQIHLVPFDEVVGGIRTVPLDSDTIETARQLGICLGDEPEGTFLGRVFSHRPPRADVSAV
jgi:6-phosphofructokinase 1